MKPCLFQRPVVRRLIIYQISEIPFTFYTKEKGNLTVEKLFIPQRIFTIIAGERDSQTLRD